MRAPVNGGSKKKIGVSAGKGTPVKYTATNPAKRAVKAGVKTAGVIADLPNKYVDAVIGTAKTIARAGTPKGRLARTMQQQQQRTKKGK